MEALRITDVKRCEEAPIENITERKNAEAALRESEQNFSGIMANIAGGVITIDEAGKILSFNRVAEHTFGYSAEDMIGGRIEQLAPELQATHFYEHVESYLESEQGAILGKGRRELEGRRKDGSTFPLEFSISEMNIAGHRTFIGAMRDITARRRSEETSRQQEEHYRALFDNAGIGIALSNDGGQILDGNPAVQKMMGYTASELKGLTISDLTHPDDRQESRERRNAMVVGDKPTYQMAKRYIRKNGTTVWGRVTSTPVRDSAGKFRFSAAMIEDITEQIRVEQSLRESEARLAEVQEITDVGSWDLRIERDQPDKVHWSPGLCQIYEIKKDAFPQDFDSYMSLVHEEDRGRARRAWTEAFESDTPFADEYRIIRPDGSIRFTIMQARLLQDQRLGAKHWIGTTTDVTERKLADEQLRQSQKMEAVGQLTGGIAYDFNNILAVIVGNLDLLEEKLENDDNRHGYVTRSIDAAGRAASLTNRLLAFSRKQALNPVIVDVNKLLTGMSDLLTRTLGETVSDRFKLASNIWSTFVDEHQLEAAVLNLAINARDAMPSGGVLTMESAVVDLDQAYADSEGINPGEYVMITVSDTGHGIPEEILDHVFEPFYTTKKVGQGSGLGLSMVFGFLKQSGGHAEIYSEVDQGTTAMLLLPRTSTEHAGESDQGEPIVERGTGQVILVVEDDTALLAVAEETLGDLGYIVLSATDAEQALELLDANPKIELLFTDVVLPGGVSGIELSREALRRRSELNVLFTSGYTADAIGHSGTLDPGAELMDKPYRKAELDRRLTRLLGTD